MSTNLSQVLALHVELSKLWPFCASVSWSVNGMNNRSTHLIRFLWEQNELICVRCSGKCLGCACLLNNKWTSKWLGWLEPRWFESRAHIPNHSPFPCWLCPVLLLLKALAELLISTLRRRGNSYRRGSISPGRHTSFSSWELCGDTALSTLHTLTHVVHADS